MIVAVPDRLQFSIAAIEIIDIIILTSTRPQVYQNRGTRHSNPDIVQTITDQARDGVT